MQGASHQLFSRSAFSVNQDTPGRRSGKRNLLPQRPDRHAVSVQLGASAKLFPEAAVLQFKPVNFKGIFDNQNNFLERKRFFDEIKRTQLRGPHRCFDAGVPGNHHHHRRHAVLTHAFECCKAIDSIEPHVEKNQVRRALIEQRKALFAGRY